MERCKESRKQVRKGGDGEKRGEEVLGYREEKTRQTGQVGGETATKGGRERTIM